MTQVQAVTDPKKGGKKDAKKGDDGQDLAGDIHEEHRATDYYVEEQALEGP